ncbi:hypothetical protein TrVE_jg12537 [Triparma verrucosa]|uniref:tRNA pseudouridine synthase n=1 Tax=Triparma verrucosa TaxID=1606542 RepID=A0A9W7FGY2_9STRA|nr:hypothetical protein TrVE_jg12537 [Triparma verrucosa]
MHRQVRRFTTAASSALHPHLKRFAFSFSYHGSFYNGFPTQKDDDQESPLYTTLHRRLSLALDAFVASPNSNHTEPRRWENLTVSSRTDAGVHALRNTAHVDLPPNLDCPSKIVKGLNYHLPLTSPFSNPRRGLKSNPNLVDSIRILEAVEVPSEWSARFSAFQRSYVYKIICPREAGAKAYQYNPHPSLPFDGSTHYMSATSLDVSKMKEAAKCLVGTHDFTSFRGRKCMQKSPVMTVFDIDVSSTNFEPFGPGFGVDPDFNFSTNPLKSPNSRPQRPFGLTVSDLKNVYISVTAPAFLYNQCRNFIGSLLEVGKGNLSVEAIKEILEAKDRSYARYKKAPAHALYLVDVKHYMDGNRDGRQLLYTEYNRRRR